ncbi:hypothetical protein STEG23_019369 [Scotinomys teguina]
MDAMCERMDVGRGKPVTLEPPEPCLQRVNQVSPLTHPEASLTRNRVLSGAFSSVVAHPQVQVAVQDSPKKTLHGMSFVHPCGFCALMLQCPTVIPIVKKT